MELNTLDYIVFAVLGISVLIGFFRGFVREFLGLLSWIVAGLAMIYLTPIITEKFLDKESSSMAGIITGIIISIVILTIMSFVIYYINSKIRKSPLNFMDRNLGLLFGFIRGSFLVLLVYYIVGIVAQKEQERLFNPEEGISSAYIINVGEKIKEQFPKIFDKLEETTKEVKESADKEKAETKKEAEETIKEETTKEEDKEKLLDQLNSPTSDGDDDKKDKENKDATYTPSERGGMDKLISSHND